MVSNTRINSLKNVHVFTFSACIRTGMAGRYFMGIFTIPDLKWRVEPSPSHLHMFVCVSVCVCMSHLLTSRENHKPRISTTKR